FFGASTLISLSFELLGTGTGLPFGAYAYTGGLGPLIEIGRAAVPFTIPLSWFYMGFAAYLLGGVLVTQYRLRPAGVWNILLGAWFLTVWDLVLDPAMAYDHLPVRFWVWNEVGPYYGMPLLNLAGWIITGLTFMAVAQRLWRDATPPTTVAPRFPLAVYFANVLFCIAICAGFGLWPPIAVALALGAPLLLALRYQPESAALNGPTPVVAPSIES
ncbi:MAG: carotenoid biosynthesis protein, partial [Dehalococcoidia bacterium]|nr:carotenoid biosynthesis protein [Dehalococcoidia bacterium]